jgi:hypothetical protein
MEKLWKTHKTHQPSFHALSAGLIPLEKRLYDVGMEEVPPSYPHVSLAKG